MTTETKLWIYNTISKAALRYGIEMWVLNNRDKERLVAVEMKFWDHCWDLQN
jgi:predicted nucleic acid-binding protein